VCSSDLHGAQAHTCSVEAAAKRVHERARLSPAGHSQRHVCAACSPRYMLFCAAKQAPSRRIRSSAVLLRALLRGRNRYARSARRAMVPMPDSPDHVVSCSSRLRPRLCRGSRVRAVSSRRPVARVCIRCVSLCALVCKSFFAQAPAPRPCAGAHAGTSCAGALGRWQRKTPFFRLLRLHECGVGLSPSPSFAVG